MRIVLVAILGLFPAVLSASDDPLVARGRYLTVIGGCGDCHTPDYVIDGVVNEDVWLTGDILGMQGEWGTTYPANLRLRLAEMDEETWLKYARTMRPRPPMPWFNVAAMTDEDLRAIYRYVRYLGPAGEKAPAFVPPDQAPPEGPILLFPMPPKSAVTVTSADD